MARAQAQSSFLRATFGPIIDPGFTAAPNLLLEHGVEMGLSDKAILFIIQVQRAKFASKTGIITDADLRMESSEKTLYRIRKELDAITDEAGQKLIVIKSFYAKDETGKVKGAGTSYDFSGLFDAIVRKFPPTSQNDGSEEPTGLFVRADTKNTTPTGQNVRAIEDKMTDTLEEQEIKTYKTAPSGEIIFSDGSWTYYADETARYEDEPTVYRWDSMPRSIPWEVQQWRDEKYKQGRRRT